MMKFISIRVLTLALVTTAFGADAKRPAITGIEYVHVYAANPAASHRFYKDRLGAPEVKAAHPGTDQYQIGKDQYVAVSKAASATTGMDEIAFRTADANGLRRYLAEHGVKVPDSVRKNADGSLEFQIADPEGHRVAFVQPVSEADVQDPVSHRIIHAGLVVKDREAMDRFYKDILGFRLYWHGGMKPEETDWVAMQVPDGTDWLEYMLHVSDNPSHHELGVMNHLSLGVLHIDDAETSLEKAGWKPGNEEHKQMGKDGKWQLNVFDPDDVRVEYMEFTPAQKPCCSEFTGPHPAP